MENSPQFRFNKDVMEYLTSDTDKMHTVQMPAHHQEQLMEHKVHYDEYETITKNMRDARTRQDVPIFSWWPIVIFVCIFALYVGLLASCIFVLWSALLVGHLLK